MAKRTEKKKTRFVFAQFPHRIFIYSPSSLGLDYRLFLQSFNADNWGSNVAANMEGYAFYSHNPRLLLTNPLFTRTDSETKASLGDLYPFLFESVNQMPSDGTWLTVKSQSKLLRLKMSHATYGNQNHLWLAEIQTGMTVVPLINITTEALFSSLKDLFSEEWDDDLPLRIKKAMIGEIDLEARHEFPVITSEAIKSLKRLIAKL